MADRPKAKTISVKRVTKESLRVGKIMYPDTPVNRPLTRGECVNGIRPCPFVGCRHHLFLDVNEETGSIKYNFPEINVFDLAETCSLDIAERGGSTLEEVGDLMNITRERVRQLEAKGIDSIINHDLIYCGNLKKLWEGIGNGQGSNEEGFDAAGAGYIGCEEDSD